MTTHVIVATHHLSLLCSTSNNTTEDFMAGASTRCTSQVTCAKCEISLLAPGRYPVGAPGESGSGIGDDGGCGVTDSLCHDLETDRLYVHDFEEVRYERRLGEIIRRLGAFCALIGQKTTAK